jgi:hypothetical protein
MDTTATTHRLVQIAHSSRGSHAIADQPGQSSTLAPLAMSTFTSLLSLGPGTTQHGYQCEAYLSAVTRFRPLIHILDFMHPFGMLVASHDGCNHSVAESTTRQYTYLRRLLRLPANVLSDVALMHNVDPVQHPQPGSQAGCSSLTSLTSLTQLSSDSAHLRHASLVLVPRRSLT